MIVVDANIGVSQVIDLPFSDQAATRLGTWYRGGARLLAPTLWSYEVVSAMRRAIYLEVIPGDEAWQRLAYLNALQVEMVPPSMELNRAALGWAERLGQSRAYDAQYVALADTARAELWSADRRLVSSLVRLGVDWAHWIGEDE